MKIDTAHSSIVMLGDDIVVGKFNLTDFSDELGQIDASQTVLLPIFANYVFQETPFQVQLQPQKIQIDYRAPDLLPSVLQEVAERLASVFESAGIRAIGINLDLIVEPSRIGETAIEFCRRHFLADYEHWCEILAPDDEFSNSGRVNYLKDGIQYTLRFEPHYKTEKQSLFLDFNAHQAIEPPVTPQDALSKYDSVRLYVQGILESLQVSE